MPAVEWLLGAMILTVAIITDAVRSKSGRIIQSGAMQAHSSFLHKRRVHSDVQEVAARKLGDNNLWLPAEKVFELR